MRHRPRTTRVGFTAAALLGAASLTLAACGSSHPAAQSTKTKTTSAPSATLTVESSPSGPITRNFNPFDPSSVFSVMGGESLVYEPLLQFNLVKPGVVQPWLATSYAWSNGGKTLTLQIRKGVEFSNGQPFSAKDVAFTFNLLKKFPAINTGALPIVSASAPSSTEAVINFSTTAYTLLYYVAQVPMLPETPWSTVANPATYSDPNPVGTGPYVLTSFSTQGFGLSANPHYWGGVPKVKKVYFPVYDSNTSANLALENNQLDWAGNFVADIQHDYVAPDPSTHHYWFAPTSVVSLFPNLTVFPLNQLAVREAISDGVDRQIISTDGESGEEPPATGAGSLTGLIIPTDNSYLTSATSKYSTTYDPAKAKAILEAAGWKMGSNGYFVSPSGKPLAFTIVEPSAYTDYMTDAEIMSSELKKVGMDVTVSGISVAAWDTAVADGTFQATIHWSNSGPTPFYIYQGWLDSSLSAPIGKPAANDYERFSSSQANSLLNEFSTTDNTATQKAAIAGLGKIVATQLPVIPLVYGVAWYEYETNHFTGWPTPSDPYTVGQPSGFNMEITILHLRPIS